MGEAYSWSRVEWAAGLSWSQKSTEVFRLFLRYISELKNTTDMKDLILKLCRWALTLLGVATAASCRVEYGVPHASFEVKGNGMHLRDDDGNLILCHLDRLQPGRK